METKKRVNNNTLVCNKLEELVEQYETDLKEIKEESAKYCDDEFMDGQADMLSTVIKELKELLYEK